MNTIQMDCPPGEPRPWDLIDGVLLNTGLTSNDFTQSPSWFGHVTWALKDDPVLHLKYAAHRETIKERVTSLYHQGFIRYGTW